jgi:superfamily II DNA or RNA helicase
METLQQAKQSLQDSARNEWRLRGRKGGFSACTGVGKTKPAIDEMMEQWKLYRALDKPSLTPHRDKPNFLVAVPTEELRDVNWPDEVKKWYGAEGEEMWIACVQAVCYISLHKVRGGYYDLVILDEAHHLTALSHQFFRANVVLAVLALTATWPDPKTEPDKYMMLQEVAPVVFTYPLDQGVDEGMVSDFEINVILSVLDDRKKIIPAGNAKKRFMQTEKAAYEYQSKLITKLRIEQDSGTSLDPGKLAERIKFAELARYRFMCTLPGKLRLAQAVIEREHTQNFIVDASVYALRTLVFAGSIEQCGILCGENVYHSKSTKEPLNKFLSKEISLLGCVKALDEGVNIPDLDQGIIVQVDSNPRSLVQRIGRLVRYREGHVAKVWILCVQSTVDESWLKTALAGFDPKRIKYIAAKNYLP